MSLMLTLLCLLALSPAQDNADILAAFGRAEVYVDRAHDHYADLHNFLLLQDKNGASDVSEEDWESTVIPQTNKIAMFMHLAMKEIESVIPQKIKTDFWKQVYYDVYDTWSLNTKVAFEEVDFYRSEYLLEIGMYDNFLEMYRVIFFTKFDQIMVAKNTLVDLREQLK